MILSAHVHPKCFRNRNRSVFLQIVFQEGDQHPGRRHTGVVQRVREVFLSVLGLYADLQPPGLSVSQVAAAADFEVFLLPGAWRMSSSASEAAACGWMT